MLQKQSLYYDDIVGNVLPPGGVFLLLVRQWVYETRYEWHAAEVYHCIHRNFYKVDRALDMSLNNHYLTFLTTHDKPQEFDPPTDFSKISLLCNSPFQFYTNNWHSNLCANSHSNAISLERNSVLTPILLITQLTCSLGDLRHEFCTNSSNSFSAISLLQWLT
jgi:hypothetical protein